VPCGNDFPWCAVKAIARQCQHVSLPHASRSGASLVSRTSRSVVSHLQYLAHRWHRTCKRRRATPANACLVTLGRERMQQNNRCRATPIAAAPVPRASTDAAIRSQIARLVRSRAVEGYSHLVANEFVCCICSSPDRFKAVVTANNAPVSTVINE
jgi:hypothetical protein